jgi:RNA polymerase sigma-70 factor (ECF subfamily)
VELIKLEPCAANVGFLQSTFRVMDFTRTVRRIESIAGHFVERRESISELSDDELVAGCLAKEEEAFAELIDRYKNKVYWLVRRMAGPADAEDHTQEVFLRAYQAMPGFRQDSKFSTWLYSIARNLCLSELRKRGRRGEEIPLEEEGEERIRHFLSEAREDLEEEIERRDVSRRMGELIDRLPESHRTALTLYYVNQARYEEISDIMGVPMGTVKTYIRRARLRLRDLLLEEPDLAGLTGRPQTDSREGEGGGV